MHPKIELYKSTYDKYQNLKLAAKELGIAWQTLYVYLREADYPVTGNKEKYEAPTDKLARYTEKRFKTLVPYAEDHNTEKFQAKMDFTVKGLSIDVKAATKRDGYKNNPHKNPSFRWAFSCKVQEEQQADFLVCYCFAGNSAEDHGEVEKTLLIPREFFNNMQSLSVSCRKSKWFDFEVTEDELKSFFDSF
ncbi:hypothetical protein VPH5P1C_0074 [Vibrio phage 5P1c]